MISSPEHRANSANNDPWGIRPARCDDGHSRGEYLEKHEAWEKCIPGFIQQSCPDDALVSFSYFDWSVLSSSRRKPPLNQEARRPTETLTRRWNLQLLHWPSSSAGACFRKQVQLSFKGDSGTFQPGPNWDSPWSVLNVMMSLSGMSVRPITMRNDSSKVGVSCLELHTDDLNVQF